MSRNVLTAILILFLPLLIGPVYPGDRSVAVFLSRDLEPHREAQAGFFQVLRERGLSFQHREYDFEGDSARGREFAAAVNGDKPDLVLALGTLAAQIAREEIAGIPVVFANVLNPQASGLVESFEAPRDNLTGVALDIHPGETLEILIRLQPGTRNIGLIYHSPDFEPIIEEIRNAAEDYGIRVRARKVEDISRLPGIFRGLSDEIDAFWMLADDYIITPQTTQYLLLQTLRRRLPCVGISPPYVRAGALFCLYWDSGDIGKQAGEMAIDILTGPPEVPIPPLRPRRQFLYLNQNVASQLNIQIPPRLRDRAVEIYR